MKSMKKKKINTTSNTIGFLIANWKTVFAFIIRTVPVTKQTSENCDER